MLLDAAGYGLVKIMWDTHQAQLLRPTALQQNLQKNTEMMASNAIPGICRNCNLWINTISAPTTCK